MPPHQRTTEVIGPKTVNLKRDATCLHAPQQTTVLALRVIWKDSGRRNAHSSLYFEEGDGVLSTKLRRTAKKHRETNILRVTFRRLPTRAAHSQSDRKNR